MSTADALQLLLDEPVKAVPVLDAERHHSYDKRVSTVFCANGSRVMCSDPSLNAVLVRHALEAWAR